MGFRVWLRGLLEEKTVYKSQYDLAERVGISQPTVANWLKGIRHPDRDRCDLISKATGKPVAEILEMVLMDARESSDNGS